jgi:hypothetical protein
MDSGRLSSFVLPWIDKFFISSLREDDLDYLPLVIYWLQRADLNPLILFWEDTSHARTPSFKLALRRFSRRGLPYRGIGIYDEDESKRSEAETLICKEHETVRLFALRPFTDAHLPRSLDHLLEHMDWEFFRHYDSSWKDNLSFLYSGTQVHPLLSVQCEAEDFSPWVITSHGKAPFGAWLRNHLMKKLGLNCRIESSNSIWNSYAAWANLLY